jgi:RimJ/RimL family protein N-acetyltransferase
MSPALAFRPLQRDELPLLHEWLARPHVARWWNEGERTLDEVVAHYLPALEGTDPTDHYMVLLDGRPMGFMETYLIADHPEWDAIVNVGPGIAGVDLFIADPELTGQGLGTEMLRRFVDEFVFAPDSTTACVSDMDVDNAASLRAFEKAGFRRVGEIVDPDSRRPHALLRRDRYS